MNNSNLSDIYLIRRRKSRTGCLLMLFVLALVAVITAAVYFARSSSQPAPDGSEPGEDIEFGMGAHGTAPDEPEPSYVVPPLAPDTGVPVPSPVQLPAPHPAPTASTPTPAPSASTIQPSRTLTPEERTHVSTLLQAARKEQQADNLQGAREAALTVLDLQPGQPEAETILNQIAMPLLMSPRPMPEKVDYTVQSGDYLGKLATRYNTPIPLIAKANNIQGANIRVGDRLRLLDGKNHIFAVNVSKTQNTLLLTLDGRYFKRYRVGTGEYSKTPVGQFKIIDKIEQPVWWRPDGKSIPYGDPENLLGTHWLALDIRGYGLHGTWEPETIGRQSSAGCVRLLNNEIEELYTILPKGTVVTIVE